MKIQKAKHTLNIDYLTATSIRNSTLFL